jgi:DHA2 family multidrug resistance protein
MLQALFGYSATDAGLVLGPGAFVIVALAPVVVKILPKVDPRKMIGLAFFIVALAMWNFASLDLGTDYNTYAWARAFQGLGLAFLFIPTSQLVYSYLPAGKNNKASSITNLFRNLGGSFGVAFVTTMLERRTQFHHSILAQHLTPADTGFQQTLDSITQYLIAQGSSAADAAQRAYGLISGIADRNAAMLGFLDCFWLLGFVALIGLVLSFTIRKFGSSGAAGGH